MHREDRRKRCEYPGEKPVYCPECNAEIDAVVVEERDDCETTVHCPSCAAIIEYVLEE